MDLRTYQAAAATTACYPGVGANVVYPALGLVGEACEVADKVESQAVGVVAELGDVLWYAAMLASELGVELADLDAGEPAGPLEVTSAVLRLVASCGRLTELVKKALRDAGGIIDGLRRDALVAELAAVLRAVGLVAVALGVDVASVAAANVAKLVDRVERQVVHGAGDTR